MRTNKHAAATSDIEVGLVDPSDLAKWTGALAELHNPVVPKGWYTLEQLMTIFKLSRVSAWRRLRKLTAAGKVEMQRFRVQRAARLYNAPHYRLAN